MDKRKAETKKYIWTDWEDFFQDGFPESWDISNTDCNYWEDQRLQDHEKRKLCITRHEIVDELFLIKQIQLEEQKVQLEEEKKTQDIKEWHKAWVELETQTSDIKNWFKEWNKEYPRDLTKELKNDLFFGCGLMLKHQRIWRQNIEMKRSYAKADFYNKDWQYYLNMMKLIGKTPGATETGWRALFAAEFGRLAIKWTRGCNLPIGTWRDYEKMPKTKFPPINKKIAVYLAKRIGQTNRGSFHAWEDRKNENANEEKNDSHVAEILHSLASLFGFTLPANLRKIL